MFQNKGNCATENHQMSAIMVPMIITSSPTTPPVFENHAKFDYDAKRNASSSEIVLPIKGIMIFIARSV